MILVSSTIKPVTAYDLSLLKAPLLLLKIQSSTVSSSLLFSTQSAQLLPLISSTLLSPLFSSNVFFFFLLLAALSPSTSVSCELLNPQYLSRDTLPFFLIFSFAHCYVDCLLSSNSSLFSPLISSHMSLLRVLVSC